MTFSINLNVQHVNGMTRFDYMEVAKIILIGIWSLLSLWTRSRHRSSLQPRDRLIYARRQALSTDKTLNSNNHPLKFSQYDKLD